MSMITPPSDPAPVEEIQEAQQVDPGALTAVEAAELGLTPAAKPRSMLRRGWRSSPRTSWRSSPSLSWSSSCCSASSGR
jgi:hypothetical protein